jgi:NTP pyrophosphatase (non-canonical NTP hydrolase)
MTLAQLSDRAMQIRDRYAELARQQERKVWAAEDLMQGFVVDVGDLMRLVMAKQGLREEPGADEKLAHELCDCLWSILVLARLHGVDLTAAFPRAMDELERKLSGDDSVDRVGLD